MDTASKRIQVPNGELYLFNGVGYRVQPYTELKAEVVAIAKKIVNGETNEKIKDPVDYIKKESIHGTLDFNQVLEKETQMLFLVEGVGYNKKDFAIYLWGKKVKAIGLKSTKEAVKLWEEIHHRPLTAPEKKSLISGFESKDK